MIRGHNDPFNSRAQIHGAAHPRDQLSWYGPVGDIPLFIHLKGSQHCRIDMSTPDIGKRGLMVTYASAFYDRRRLSAGINDVDVLFAPFGCGAAATWDTDISFHRFSHKPYR